MTSQHISDACCACGCLTRGDTVAGACSSWGAGLLSIYMLISRCSWWRAVRSRYACSSDDTVNPTVADRQRHPHGGCPTVSVRLGSRVAVPCESDGGRPTVAALRKLSDGVCPTGLRRGVGTRMLAFVGAYLACTNLTSKLWAGRSSANLSCKFGSGWLCGTSPAICGLGGSFRPHQLIVGCALGATQARCWCP